MIKFKTYERVTVNIMTITEKAAYVKGLAEGAGLDQSAAETKVLNAIIDLLGDLADAFDEIDDDLAELEDYVEELDEDLGDVEEIIYDLDDFDDDDDFDLCDCDCCDDDCDCDEDMFCAMCPECGEQICFDDSVDPSDVICPKCGKALVDEEPEAE